MRIRGAVCASCCQTPPHLHQAQLLTMLVLRLLHWDHTVGKDAVATRSPDGTQRSALGSYPIAVLCAPSREVTHAEETEQYPIHIAGLSSRMKFTSSVKLLPKVNVRMRRWLWLAFIRRRSHGLGRIPRTCRTLFPCAIICHCSSRHKGRECCGNASSKACTTGAAKSSCTTRFALFHF